MNSTDASHRSGIRYEADESPPLPLAIGLGLQLAALALGGIVLTPAIIVRAAGGDEAFLAWAVFAAVAVSGITTVLQAARVGRIGAGYVLLMGTSGAFIAVSVTALAEGGPAMLATLVVISSLFQFGLSTKLSLFRRILTPTVVGTMIMLIAVTIMPIVFGMLKTKPDGISAIAPALVAVVTILTILGIALKATGTLRLWAPVVGVIIGSVAAGYFGLYDIERVLGAAWVGTPAWTWPGFDLEFGPVFWKLLPAFIFVTLVGAMETIGDASAIQGVSWRRPRAVDFRAVQGAVAADGMGNLLSGLAGTVPNTTYSSSIAVTELTGVAARTVGVAIGCIFVVLAFLPKALSVILAIPDAVVAAYLTVILAMLFAVGMKMVVQAGLDYRSGLIAGVSFWMGVGFQNGLIFPEYVSAFAGGLLENGMTAGGLTAILMTLFLELAAPRRKRLETEFGLSALPEIREFLGDFAAGSGLDATTAQHLDAAGEESIHTLARDSEGETEQPPRRLRLTAHREDGGAVLEFVVAGGDENVEDRIALLGEGAVLDQIEHEVSLRLLRHLASSVRHQQYHDTDILTVRVDAGSRNPL